MTMRPPVLVAGGAGYIGSHVCKALSAVGFLPVTYDNLSGGHREAVLWGPLEEGELGDLIRLDQIFRHYRPVAVMHFAALIEVGASMTDPARFYANNVVNTLCLLQAMRRAGVQRIVLSSTAAVYGWPQRIPIPEDHLLAPNNPYGATKHACESMLADFARAYGLRSIALRYFNACGADPDGEIGEAHDPETHLIPLVLRTAAGESGDIAIFGDDYETPDGTCLRDYVHVSDIADAHVAALRHLERHDGAQVYNLGTGRGHSVREVIACAERVCGRRIPARLRPRRPGDPPMLVADPTKAMNVLGWYPRWPDLESQIVHAWQWQCRRVDTAGPPRVRLVPEQRRKFNGAHR